ncbi:hypothetical protein [Actinomadura sp. 7K507]|uniref:hypothetical protein n=1 Tax=Actinomadura sp. 7K507 TaxID=2530365 RepID=UPI0010443A9A|nr:hypothetical protein [Actinomadura sp. 7K507]TDC86272.1 hypothetical protein E1285_23940 [Actinomadura sp. 7K507]
MNEYWFDLEVAGPVTDEHVGRLAEVIIDRFGDGVDATVQADERGGVVMFSREAEDVAEAIMSAIADVREAGMAVTGVDGGDLVAVETIATRAKVTVHAVRHWVAGVRGPGGFPEPVRQRLFSWAQVSEWLVRNKLGQVDHAAVEAARAATFFNALLTADRTVDEVVPRHRRAELARVSTRLAACG